jgi:hypothetical protein
VLTRDLSDLGLVKKHLNVVFEDGFETE